MTYPLCLLSIYCLFIAFVSSLSPAEWRAQSIYQVVTDRFARTDGSTSAGCDMDDYCGGTWRGLINHLDYIQGMGFTAVWISPVVKNPIQSSEDGNSYHGYWAQDLYSVNPMFGTEEDLKALSHELHQRGMYLMLDVVPNHMGSHSPRDQVDYSQLNPFNDQSYFHPPCAVDYNNPATLQNCWLGSNRVSLPDLRTEDPTVANMFNRWISEMVANYSIDGLRIDTAQHVDPAFLSGFQAAAGGIHVLGEVWNGNPEELCPHQNTMTGLLNYASYYWITQAFQNSTTNLTTLRNNLEWLQARCRDVTVLGTFIENHDNPRYANTTTDPSRIRNALAFALLADGIPIIYQGQEHLFAGGPVPTNREPLWPTAHDPTTTPLYPFLRALNRARSRAIAHDPAFVTYHAHAVGLGPDDDDRSLLVMRKGHAGAQIVAVFNNLGAAAGARPVTVGGKAGFTPGQVVVDVLTCRAYGVDRRGNVGVEIRAGEPIVLFPQAVLESGTCGQP